MQAPLKDKQDIKIFILYLMKEINTPLNFVTLADICLQDDFVRQFDFFDCLFDLIENGMVKKTSSENGDIYEITEKGKDYVAGMFGGAGLNTLNKQYLDRYNLPYTLRETFLKGIDRVYNIVPDVHIGNHLENSNHFEKLKRCTSEVNAFIDGSTWQSFLAAKKQEAINLFEKDRV